MEDNEKALPGKKLITIDQFQTWEIWITLLLGASIEVKKVILYLFNEWYEHGNVAMTIPKDQQMSWLNEKLSLDKIVDFIDKMRSSSLKPLDWHDMCLLVDIKLNLIWKYGTIIKTEGTPSYKFNKSNDLTVSLYQGEKLNIENNTKVFDFSSDVMSQKIRRSTTKYVTALGEFYIEGNVPRILLMQN